jgi:HPt (histidine-containing phosphotransfer) domain-containing protein
MGDLINLEIVDSLKSLGMAADDKPFVNEIIELYFAEVPSLLTKIKTAIDNLDFQTLKVEAHTFKGASANVGASGVSAICSTLEQKAKSDSGEGLQEDYKNLEALLEVTKIEFDKILS